MNMELRELYQEIIIDHNRNPRNHHTMDDATAEAKGFNPLCGDKLTVFVKVNNEVINDISFLGCGCAISQASASLMTDALKGKSVAEAHQVFHKVHQMLTSEDYNPMASMDKLSVLAGVKAFPARVKCATLAWHTLEAALNKEMDVVKTE
ncbi:Fe-S cluster assembly sulfur transfer protein SufU [Legionella waltersii]|uniref:Nitrogen fixation protein NifU n=1 Tax=Legionella waltersii TaxID=66969 RepID=A0A0W1ADD6_9GAMM|nr:SUF system NifU family Fe-S cluster assembly protein [Legionella waltersii]KTD79359.1 nitrogen fixation protein NifU [Legionella waltersii]SNU99859.1 nitrogen fixation protein NifU [Legionella waltersii]